MTDLNNGVIELFSQKIYLGMPYNEILKNIEGFVRYNTLEKSKKNYGYISTERTALFGLKEVACRLFVFDSKLNEITFEISPTYDEYVKDVPKECLSRQFYYDLIDRLYDDVIAFIKSHFEPCSTVVNNEKNKSFIFNGIILSVVMERDNESFSITIGEHHE